MDKSGYIQKRKARCMAQILEAFEDKIEPHLSPQADGDAKSFKALVRARLVTLADDASDVATLGDEGAINGAAQEIRDRLSPTGRL